jgi:hypothetical protein
MLGGPVATLVMAPAPAPDPRRRHRDRAATLPEGLALHYADVPFALGATALASYDRAPARGPAERAAPFAQAAGATLSSGGGRLAAERVAEIRVVSPLPDGAETVTIEPHAGSAVLAIQVRDARGLHPVPLRCADLLAGWWQIGTDRLGRTCWQSGEAVLRLPPLHGAASVEVTLVEVE